MSGWLRGALWFYSLGTFAWSAQAILARGFYALQDTRTPTVITTIMVGLFALLCATLPGTGLEYRGLALALSIAGTANMAVFFAVLSRRTGGIDAPALLIATLRIVAAAAASALLGKMVRTVLWNGPEHATRFGSLAVVAGTGAVCLSLYAIACVLLKVPELRTFRTLLRRKPAAAQ